MRPRTFLLFILAGLMGAAVAVLPTLATAGTSEVKKLEVNQNCVENAWPCWAVQGSGSDASAQPALRIEIAPGGKVMFTDHDASTNPTGAATVSWTGLAPTNALAYP